MLHRIISRARRRFVVNKAVREIAWSGIAVCALFTLVLLLGTRWLDWPLVAVAALASAGYAAYRVYRSVPSHYASAVLLDRHARLNDSLSTALHFEAEPGEFATLQRREAEQRAAAVDVNAAIPLSAGRPLYGLGAMLLLTFCLLGLRYGFAHTLDLRAPITEVFFQDLAAHRPADLHAQERDSARRKQLETAESLLARMGVPLSPEDAKQPDAIERAIDQALAPPSNGLADKGPKGDDGGKAENGRGATSGDKQPAGDPMDDKQAGAKPPGDDKGAGDKGAPKSGGSSDSPGLLSKLKDAVSNLMSKASQNKDAGQKSSAQEPKQASKGEKGKADKSAGKQDQADSSSDAQDGEPNGDAKDGQQGEAKSASKSAQQSGQSGSGVGNQDGMKDLRAAEQLKAMGKLSEIIGKRAAMVSGETTVEVQSGNQKLTTAYSSKAARHGESDGDVTRDEIPVGLQSYVRQYFDQVHKAPPSGKTKPAQ